MACEPQTPDSAFTQAVAMAAPRPPEASLRIRDVTFMSTPDVPSITAWLPDQVPGHANMWTTVQAASAAGASRFYIAGSRSLDFIMVPALRGMRNGQQVLAYIADILLDFRARGVRHGFCSDWSTELEPDSDGVFCHDVYTPRQDVTSMFAHRRRGGLWSFQEVPLQFPAGFQSFGDQDSDAVAILYQNMQVYVHGL